MFDVTTGQTSQVAQHDAPIKTVKWVETPGMGILATGSWDKTIKVRAGRLSLLALRCSRLLSQYWDLRQPQAITQVTLPERCYTFDVQYPLMVVGTAERHIQIFNLTNPTAAYKVGVLLHLKVSSRSPAQRPFNLH